MTELSELFALISDEEKAAASDHIKVRIEAMADQDDGPIRARIFAGCTLVAGAELFAQLDCPNDVAAQLRRLADRIEAGQAVRH